MTRHTLPGLRPTPLASYLAGLGLVRLLGVQADPDLTATWTDDGLVVDTAVADLSEWLVDRYLPTPVLSPWNEGSGFGAKDVVPKQRLAALVGAAGARFEPFRTAMPAATRVAQRYRSAGWKKDEAKERAVREFRNRCPEELLPWIDAAVVLGGEGAYFPPLLGTGGNDGRLDFSTTFHQRLLEVLDPAPAARGRSRAQAADLLAGTQVERLEKLPIGQFDPAAAGGKGSSPFGDADSMANPWSFVLLVEGALLFAASAARRQLHGARRAAIPFTVLASPDGSPSGADDETSRGEVWAPAWRRPFTWPEIRQLFAEARASWNGRPAQRAAEFYAATRTLGVARGVDTFVRYGLHQRNGLAFVAVPVEVVTVEEKRAVRLAGRLEEWVSWVRRGEPATAVGRAVRRYDTAHFEFVRDGDAWSLVRLLAALTDLEQTVGRSGRARESVPVRLPPSARDFLPELWELTSLPELRIAVGIASCAARAGRDQARQPSRSMRQLLLPVDPDGRWRDAPVVAGLGIRPLRSVLADVLVWRSRTAFDEPVPDDRIYRGAPTFRLGVRVPEADLHAFAVPGRLGDGDLDLFLRACLALRWDRVRPVWTVEPGPPAPPVTTLGLLQPFAAGISVGPQDEKLALGLSPDWALRLAAGQVSGVHAEAVRRLRQAGWRAAAAPPPDRLDGPAIAAALVPLCRDPRFALRTYLAYELKSEEEIS